MKKIFLFIIIFSALIAFTTSSYSQQQCKDLVRNTALDIMNTSKYTHDGHFNSTEMEEGEEADLYKTFFAGERYRVVVCGDPNLPFVEFQVLDMLGNVLFTNKNSKVKFWDVKVKSSQKLIISVKVPANSKNSNPVNGCVAVVVGIKE